MKTASVMIQSLCVPCRCRCRHCLLSWSGRTEGAEWGRSVRLAERFLQELRESRPELSCAFSFGYSMEHPELREALRTLRRLGSPTAEFLQCDGMKMRDEIQCGELMRLLREENVKKLNFTFYGLPEYHDRFAGRPGDHALLLRMIAAAGEHGLPFTAGICLTAENPGDMDELTAILRDRGCEKVSLFVPHEEGRGRALAAVRCRERDLDRLSPETCGLLDPKVYRPEGEWLREAEPLREERRSILISLRRENIEDYESRSAASVLAEVEALDEGYYSAFPSFRELAERYGDPEGEKLYRIRDLYHHYRLLYGEEHRLPVCDVTDERFSGSRRS